MSDSKQLTASPSEPTSGHLSHLAVPGHTPGPWTLHTHNQVITSKRSVLDVAICRMIADEREGQNPEANARLIASAPEMLECLNRVAQYLDAVPACDADPVNRQYARDMLRTVDKIVAKAEGRE